MTVTRRLTWSDDELAEIERMVSARKVWTLPGRSYSSVRMKWLALASGFKTREPWRDEELSELRQMAEFGRQWRLPGRSYNAIKRQRLKIGANVRTAPYHWGDPASIEEVKRLSLNGWSQSRIAEKFGVSTKSVFLLLKKLHKRGELLIRTTKEGDPSLPQFNFENADIPETYDFYVRLLNEHLEGTQG